MFVSQFNSFEARKVNETIKLNDLPHPPAQWKCNCKVSSLLGQNNLVHNATTNPIGNCNPLLTRPNDKLTFVATAW